VPTSSVILGRTGEGANYRYASLNDGDTFWEMRR